MKRREFCQGVIIGCAGVGAMWEAGCGDDDGGGSSDGGECNAQAEIMSNHGHVLNIPPRDVRSGMGGTYTVTGGTHTHSVTITPTLFRNLQSSGSIMVGTEGGGDHEHPIRIICA